MPPAPLISLGEVVANRPSHREFPGDPIRIIREAVRTGWLTPVKRAGKVRGLWFRRDRVDQLWALPAARYRRQSLARWIMWHLRDEFGWRIATIARLFGCSQWEARMQIRWVRAARLHMGTR
jgi:hypothetical protein